MSEAPVIAHRPAPPEAAPGERPVRHGGDVVVEALEALGARAAFGVPGVHALAIWDALRAGSIAAYGMRTELCAGFAADGFARAGGEPAVLLLSTGPGALNSLTALMEAASAHVPLVAISSQVPRALLGRGRGYLHELADQRASFTPIVKLARRAESADALPELLAEAWRVAQTPPSGPVYLEVPVDVLREPAATPRPDGLDGAPPPPAPAHPGAIAAAAAVLAAAERPLIWAGGGVQRSGAWDELLAVAERLRAPVATTYMGKGSIPADHPLALGSGCDEAAFQEAIAGADAVLCVGTELGAETTGQYALRFGGPVVQVDAAPERIGATYPALGLVGDAAATLAALVPRLPARPPDGRAEALVAAVRERIARGLDARDHRLERGLLADVAAVAGPEAIVAWDMTILAYWAAAHHPVARPRTFLYPLGSGTLGYAWPAALGAQAARPGARTLAVTGDGGLHYALGELASARQHGLATTLLVVDDGGYGILREYQQEAFGATHAVDLAQPDFAALCAAFGVPARAGGPDDLRSSLAWALEHDGPAAVVVSATLAAPPPTP